MNKITIQSLALLTSAWTMAAPMPVPHTNEPISIDGKLNEAIWQQANWYPIDQLLLGEKPQPDDFQAQYALSWDRGHLYLAAKIIDDVLFDQNQDPLNAYWDDDCLEIFIDADASGGDHQYNHNAFAYHLGLDGQVVDIGQDKNPRLYNEHVENKWLSSDKHRVWEAKIKIFDASYQDQGNNTPITLTANQQLGFMLAYCDNDASPHREHFIGSQPIKGEDKNLGWKTADVFGKITLSKSIVHQ